MRFPRKVLWPAMGFFLVMGAAALAVWTPSAIELQADAEARFVAGQQVAARHSELATSWQKVAEADGPLKDAQTQVNNLLAKQNALAGPLQATLTRIRELERAGSKDRGVLYLTPGDYIDYNEKKKILNNLNAQAQTIDDRLGTAQQNLQSAQHTYADAFKVYSEQLRQFQDEFDKLFKDEYPKRLKALQDLAKANQARLSQVFIVQELLPGEYAWSESAKDLGKVTITADNKVTGVPPDGREGTWQVTATGLEVTVGEQTWLFRPGPMFSLMGSTKTAGAGTAVRQALLRPTTPPDQAAYSAALKKLKAAAKEATAAKAETVAAQPGTTAAQPATSAALSAAAEGQPAGTHVLKVEALVDGESWLVLQGNRLHWENKSYSVPGSTDREHPGGPFPTVVNGTPWMPVWRGRVSEPTDLPFTLPADLSGIAATVNTLQGRSRPTVVVRGDSLIVDIDDREAGSDQYVIELRISDKSGAAGPEADTPPPAGPAAPTSGPGTRAPAATLRSAASVAMAPQAAAQRSDYELLGVANGAAMPEPVTVHVGAHEWPDVADQDWLTVTTRYHRLHFKSSSDRRKVEQLYQHLDNLYTFLAARSPVLREPLIDAFLIPGESGHSRCSLAGSMRTGDNGDFTFNLTSFLHEETHLFNFAYLGHVGQNAWSGELSCQYFQERARLTMAGTDPRSNVLQTLPRGPHCVFGAIEGLNQQAFGEAFAANYFLEETYGKTKHSEFRVQRLRLDKDKGPDAPTGPLFRQVFGKDEQQLDHEWKAFYGWDGAGAPAGPQAAVQVLPGGQPGAPAMAVVSELSSSAYAGRATGGEGEAKAARYVESAFRSIGLAPADGVGYSRAFSVPYRDLVGPVGLVVGQRQFAYMRDFGVLQGGPQQWAQGPVVFAGYGRSGAGHDDWRGIEVRGRVVVLLIPHGGKADGAAFRQAEQRGALAVLMVGEPGDDDVAAFARKQVALGASMPVLHVSSAVGDTLLEGTGWSLGRLARAAEAGQAGTPILQQQARVAAGAVSLPDCHSANIVGILRGRSDHCVLLMAHYDGQGLAGDGSHYPGANDNASGVGVMLEVASELARRQSELPISVVFAALGAEEIGMRGASELVQHPPIPLERVALAVNLDMEGAGDGSLTVQTTSADMPAYRRLTALASRRNITTKPYVRTQLGADADVVQAAGVPTLFIVTGGTEHHTVHDDMSNVSRQTMANVTGLLEEFIAGYAG